ncbi:MAG: TIGR04283 family arsenosugar biosynthesis glycosyltransferase [Gammaproteobacteria bacterium]|nr:TIGR04283 family arsenosugar biosynthesis glycosyltransferase [Gammaproteobacteria bacterium]
MSRFNVSIIVPVFNEADQLTPLMNRLRLLQDRVTEIIIVDGGSDDGSFEKLSSEFQVIQAEKGRANQMNAGAAQATSTWLIFLHADTHLSPSHINDMISLASLSQWGRFDVKLDDSAWAFRIIEWFINRRSSLTSIATGDQCIFVRKRFFDELGGYASLPLMEDVEFCKRAKRQAKPVCLRKAVTTSARRWQQFGVLKTVLLMWKLRLYFWLGVSADDLAKQYR